MTHSHAARPVTVVPPPPSPFTALTHALEAGALLHRVHDRKRAGNEFNPGMGEPTRFAHFDGGSGVVPSLYAAATNDAAICESLLHDTPPAGGLLARSEYVNRTMTDLELQRDVKLAKIMGDGLRHLKIDAQDITDTNGAVYDKTVAWAQAAHAAGFEGLAWMSARDNTAQAYVFFGDRVDATDLKVSGSGLGTFAPNSEGFFYLEAFCARVHVELTI